MGEGCRKGAKWTLLILRRRSCPMEKCCLLVSCHRLFIFQCRKQVCRTGFQRFLSNLWFICYLKIVNIRDTKSFVYNEDFVQGEIFLKSVFCVYLWRYNGSHKSVATEGRWVVIWALRGGGGCNRKWAPGTRLRWWKCSDTGLRRCCQAQ